MVYICKNFNLSIQYTIMSTRFSKSQIIIQPVREKTGVLKSVPTPLAVILSTISLYRSNSEISDKELAIEIEDNLTRLMRLNSLKIITAGPNYSVLGPCGQLLFEESDNSPYYAKE